MKNVYQEKKKVMEKKLFYLYNISLLPVAC